MYNTQQLHTWGLHSNQGGRTHSEVPECCVCSSTGLCGCDSTLAAGRHGHYTHTAHSHSPPPGRNQSSRDDSAHNEAQSSNLEEKKYQYQGSGFDHNIKRYFSVRHEGFTLAFIADPWCSYTGGVEVAATVYITLHTAENQSGGVGRPAEGTFTLEPWAPTTLALTTLVVAPVGGIKTLVKAFSMIMTANVVTRWERDSMASDRNGRCTRSDGDAHVWLQCCVPSPVYPLSQ